jgi:hypothetical protein
MHIPNPGEITPPALTGPIAALADIGGPFFVDALMVMLLAVLHIFLTHRQSHWNEPDSVETIASVQTQKDSRSKSVEQCPEANSRIDG